VNFEASQNNKTSNISSFVLDNSSTIVSSASSGKFTLSIASFISVNTFLVSTQLYNSTLIELIQTDDLEVIFFIPSRSFISFSILSVIRASISVGLTHIYGVTTDITPNLISGLDSLGILYKEKIQATIIKNINKYDTLYFLTQKPKNQLSICSLILSITLLGMNCCLNIIYNYLIFN
jgi:hypothetical protein